MPIYRTNRIQEYQDGHMFLQGDTTTIKIYDIDGTIVQRISDEPYQTPIEKEILALKSDFTLDSANNLYIYEIQIPNNIRNSGSIYIDYIVDGNNGSLNIIQVVKGFKCFINNYPKTSHSFTLFKAALFQSKKRIEKITLAIDPLVYNAIGDFMFIIQMYSIEDGISF